MAAFATPADLAAYLADSSWDESAALVALNGATAVIQNVTGQTIAAVAGDVVTLDPDPSGTVVLPQIPVTAVARVEILVPAPVAGADTWVTLDPGTYRWNSRGLLYLTRGNWQWPNQWDSVRVTYSHGYDPIPIELFTLCMDIAARTLDNPYKYNATSVGGVSTGMGTGGAGVTLRDTELVVMDRYTVLEVA